MNLETVTSSSVLEWYLAATKPRQEVRAIENLKNQGIIAYSPVVNLVKNSAGHRRKVTEALFPGYIFINISIESNVWPKVKSTRGIKDWVRFSGKPAKLPNQLVERLKKEKQETFDAIGASKIVCGSDVRILDGPFEGLTGVYECSSGEQRSMILLEFLGSQSRVSLFNHQITVN